MHRSYLSLGSNLGDTAQNIMQATKTLQNSDVTIVRVSSFYTTEPQGRKDVPWYCNAVLEINTQYNAQELLQHTMHVESILGRERTGALHEPRTIDIDILLYDNDIIDTDILSIPHARMCERAFVLIPLQEIAPHIVIYEKTLQEHLDALSYSIEGDSIWQY